jgi:uncharacterized beta-barrel protein YwiB (DUF1934 family)
MKKVIVTVVGTQRDAAGEESRIELVTVGSRQEKNGISYITYRESEISGLEGTTTLLKLYPDYISVVRMGAVEHKQEYRLGEPCPSLYITPYGSLKMTVLTRRLERVTDGRGETITAGYDLAIDGQWQSYNTLAVNIREERLDERQTTAH